MSLPTKMEEVTFSYVASEGANPMLFDCSFAAGVITAIMGASGSGKSTLLALLAGFERVQSGRILFAGSDGTDLPPSDRPLSMVFQENNLFAHLSVGQNVGLGIAPKLRMGETDRGLINEALNQVGLGSYADRMPAQLSGGERQRVALARVLVRHKPLLLLDEAFASLGPGLRAEMLDLVADLSATHKLTTLMVTHAPEDAIRISRDLVFVDQGKVVLTGETSDLLGEGSENPTIKAYLGATKRSRN